MNTDWQIPINYKQIMRDRALIEQGGVCCYCRSKLHRAKATAEHRKPRSKGGLWEQDNIAAACRLCNVTKGNKSEAQFKKLIKHPQDNLNLTLIWSFRRINLATERACKHIISSVSQERKSA